MGWRTFPERGALGPQRHGPTDVDPRRGGCCAVRSLVPEEDRVRNWAQYRTGSSSGSWVDAPAARVALGRGTASAKEFRIGEYICGPDC
ncbi:Uncharacterised protein [Mycobacteroides abscessus subsp. abscessus]|nr:Uncharacterised protein [Mycobacteroides abscessus subsp. abscessus]